MSGSNINTGAHSNRSNIATIVNNNDFIGISSLYPKIQLPNITTLFKTKQLSDTHINNFAFNDNNAIISDNNNNISNTSSIKNFNTKSYRKSVLLKNKNHTPSNDNIIRNTNDGTSTNGNNNKKAQGRPVSLEVDINVSLYNSVRDYVIDLVSKNQPQQSNPSTPLPINSTTNTQLNNFSIIKTTLTNPKTHQLDEIQLDEEDLKKKGRKFKWKIVSKSFKFIPQSSKEPILPHIKKELNLSSNESIGFIRAHRNPGGKITKFDFVPILNEDIINVKSLKKNICFPRYKAHMRISLIKTSSIVNSTECTNNTNPMKFYLSYKEYMHDIIWKNNHHKHLKFFITREEDEDECQIEKNKTFIESDTIDNKNYRNYRRNPFIGGPDDSVCKDIEIWILKN
ncbi:uncharacterized protein SCDLUD_001971 [Saccharomycodes ludwigii]|uniref:uncharacterized protein n=1 Tax=Saccharomycodes ludwigii TaxID=36035 RepID=UPI001E877C0B|nr:hypothetical protein SCDLUD_001971 [Saccharomycodes ludwigii]KAH3902158.1 hypothetical protein SCDLUD_001971 [Saccharomycodes ludwigii]